MKSKNISKYFILFFLNFSATKQEYFLFSFDYSWGHLLMGRIRGSFLAIDFWRLGVLGEKIWLNLVLIFHFFEFLNPICRLGYINHTLQKVFGFHSLLSSCGLCLETIWIDLTSLGWIQLIPFSSGHRIHILIPFGLIIVWSYSPFNWCSEISVICLLYLAEGLCWMKVGLGV